MFGRAADVGSQRQVYSARQPPADRHGPGALKASGHADKNGTLHNTAVVEEGADEAENQARGFVNSSN
jgi:hypothetical protein